MFLKGLYSYARSGMCVVPLAPLIYYNDDARTWQVHYGLVASRAVRL